jgi:hypothetical protein
LVTRGIVRIFTVLNKARATNKGYMQVVVTKEIKSAYTGRVLQVKKIINPELCVDTMKIARESAIGAKEKNDCVVRAFMAALDTSYDSTHAFVKKYLKRVNGRGTFTSTHLPTLLVRLRMVRKSKCMVCLQVTIF